MTLMVCNVTEHSVHYLTGKGDLGHFVHFDLNVSLSQKYMNIVEQFAKSLCLLQLTSCECVLREGQAVSQMSGMCGCCTTPAKKERASAEGQAARSRKLKCVPSE